MINNVVLQGRLTRDNELQYAKSGKAFLRNTIAVQRNYKNQNNEYESDFITVLFYGKTAELLNNYTVKGSMIGVVGHIETGSYTNNQNQTIYTTNVVCEQLSLLESKKNNQQTQSQAQQAYQNAQAQNTVNNSANWYPQGTDVTNQITEESLPF